MKGGCQSRPGPSATFLALLHLNTGHDQALCCLVRGLRGTSAPLASPKQEGPPVLKKEELMHLTEPSVRAWLPFSLYTQCRPAAPVVAPTADCTQQMGVGRLGDTQKILCQHPSLWLTKATSEDGHRPRVSQQQHCL